MAISRIESQAVELSLGRCAVADPIRQPSLSVVIPAYNEEERLPETMRNIIAYLARQKYPSQVIVVMMGAEIIPATLSSHSVPTIRGSR